MEKIVVGNWKMHGDNAFVRRFAADFHPPKGVAVAVCPPFPYLPAARAALAETIMVGAQDVSADAEDGARTGEVSARMLADSGCALTIIGHSERRAGHAESDELCAAKITAAAAAGLRPLLCVGESARDDGNAVATVLAQLDAALAATAAAAHDKLIIAYEPVWAIGSGKTPTTDDIAVMHNAIRQRLIKKTAPVGDKIPLLYGGSVNAENAATIIGVSQVGGFLVGGASLKAEQFGVICGAGAIANKT